MLNSRINLIAKLNCNIRSKLTNLGIEARIWLLEHRTVSQHLLVIQNLIKKDSFKFAAEKLFTKIISMCVVHDENKQPKDIISQDKNLLSIRMCCKKAHPAAGHHIVVYE